MVHESETLDGEVTKAYTPIPQSTARASVVKKCARCKLVEGTLMKSGVTVIFDENPRNGTTYATCRRCKKYLDESHAKVSLPD